MATRTRTLITIETRQAIVVRPLRDFFQGWCQQCRVEVLALPRESAGSLLQISIDTVYELVACGKLHAVEVGGPSPLICCNSLSTSSTETGAVRQVTDIN